MSADVIRIPLGMTLGGRVVAPFVNAYLARCGDGWIVVDTATPGSTPAILAALARNGIAATDIRAILLTHGHFDHYGSALELAAALGGVRIAMHPADRSLVTGERLPRDLRPTRLAAVPPLLAGSLWMGLSSATGRLKPWSAETADRVIWLDEVTEDDGLVDLRERLGIPVQALLTPGHSPGSLTFRLLGGELFAGDILSHTITGAPAPPMFADQPHRVPASLERIGAQNPPMVYVGHGAPVSGEALSGLLTNIG